MTERILNNRSDDDHDRIATTEGDVRVLYERIAALKEAIHTRDVEVERVRLQQNEWRDTVTDLAAGKVDANRYEDRHSSLLDAIQQLRLERASNAEVDALEKRTAMLENWKARATGAAVVLTLVAGAIGAAIVRALGG